LAFSLVLMGGMAAGAFGQVTSQPVDYGWTYHYYPGYTPYTYYWSYPYSYPSTILP